MTKLTTKARKAIPSKDFAGPDRSYPIEDKSHARNALSRVSANGSPALKARVRAAVHRKYPSIGGKVKEESMQTRGSHEHQLKSHDKGVISHDEFQKLDHGSKHDHMPNRKVEDFEKGPKGY